MQPTLKMIAKVFLGTVLQAAKQADGLNTVDSEAYSLTYLVYMTRITFLLSRSTIAFP